MKIDITKSVTDNLLALIVSRNPKATFTASQISLGAPSAYTDPKGIDNTQITLTAVKNAGFSGTQVLYYKRSTIDAGILVNASWPWAPTDTSALVTARINAMLGALSGEFTLNGGNTLTAPTLSTPSVTVNLVVNANAKLFVPGTTKTLTLVYTLPVVNVTYATAGNNLNTLAMLNNPTAVADYRLTVTANIGSTSSTNPALTIGALPSGSKMTLINKATIQGAGGAGGTYNAAGTAGGHAIHALMNAAIDNTAGTITGGGGGGGGANVAWSGLIGLGSGYERSAGGGGAGVAAGAAGTGTAASGTNIAVTAQPAAGTASAGGAGARVSNTANTIYALGGAGGAPGAAGATGTSTAGGATGYTLTNFAGGAAGSAVNLNGFTVTVTSGNSATQVKGRVA